MFSLPVFLQPIARDTGWSVTGVSSAMTIGFLAMAFTSMIWGTLSDRLGPLPGVLTGSVVLAASLALGVFGDIAGRVSVHLRGDRPGCHRRDLCADDGVCRRLVRHPSQAGGAAGSAGMGMAPMTMSPLAAWLISAP